MAKKPPAARLTARVVASTSKMDVPRNIRITKADGTYYIVQAHPGEPILVLGESECRSLDCDVASGSLRELKLTDEQAEALLESLVQSAAVARIAELEQEVRDQRGEVKVLENELADLRGNLVKA